jgi:hypothetical protein
VGFWFVACFRKKIKTGARALGADYIYNFVYDSGYDSVYDSADDSMYDLQPKVLHNIIVDQFLLKCVDR